MKTYELKTLGDGTQYLEMTDENGQVWGVPMVAGNSDYEAYLNPNANKDNPVGGN